MKQIKSTILLVGILLLTSASSFANSKIIVGIMPFKSTEKKFASRAKELQEVIAEVFSHNKSITILDRSKVAQIEKELDRQKNANYLNGKTVPQDKAFGAEVLLIGTLTNVAHETSKFGGGRMPGVGSTGATTLSKAIISFSLEAIDVATGETIDQKTFDMAGMDASDMDFGGAYTTEGNSEKSVIRANKGKIKGDVKRWVNKIYPPNIKIASVDKKNRKGLPSQVSVIGSEDADIVVGMTINIVKYQTLEIDGKKLVKKKGIGTLRTIELQGDFILCRVVSGADIIGETMSSDNIKLIIDYDKRIVPQLHRRK